MARLRKSRSEMEKWYVRALPLALGVGALGLVMGLVVNFLLAVYGYDDVSVVAIFGAAAFAGAYFVMGILEFTGGAARRLYGGSPFSVAPPDYSYPDSLAARGLYEPAVAAYRNAAEEHPGSPEPLLRAARVLRDGLHRYAEAIELFREIRAGYTDDEGLEEVVTREIAEIHMNRLQQPERALPELARLLERHPSSPAAEWARRRMAELKREMWETVKDASVEDRPER
ncbi:MAG: hypothetical protein KY466_09285 [Gemmatimonadetes bacterium]|nr:hypothetical protein [Gemmatimonadota bacterium]